jgi:hypothetical protein
MAIDFSDRDPSGHPEGTPFMLAVDVAVPGGRM